MSQNCIELVSISRNQSLNFGDFTVYLQDGWLPIHWAAKKNSLRAVKMLMKRESSLDCMMTKVKWEFRY